MRRFASILTFALLAACGGDSTAPVASVAGSWSGSSNGGTLTMTLTQADGSISGNGQINGPGGAEALVVNGTFAAPTLSVSLTAQGFEPINLTASLVNKTQLVGALNGSGFSNLSIVLNKQ